MRWSRIVKSLVAGYFALGLAGLLVGLVLTEQHHAVNSAVWIRSGAMLFSAGLLYRFLVLAEQGKRSSLLRVRIVSVLIPLVVVGLVVMPDGFPVWMKVQQVLAGLSVAGIAVLVNWPRPKLVAAR